MSWISRQWEAPYAPQWRDSYFSHRSPLVKRSLKHHRVIYSTERKHQHKAGRRRSSITKRIRDEWRRSDGADARVHDFSPTLKCFSHNVQKRADSKLWFSVNCNGSSTHAPPAIASPLCLQLQKVSETPPPLRATLWDPILQFEIKTREDAVTHDRCSPQPLELTTEERSSNSKSDVPCDYKRKKKRKKLLRRFLQCAWRHFKQRQCEKK